MDNYFDKYFTFTRRSLSIVGLWPLQNIRQRQLIFGSLCLSAAFGLSALINIIPTLDIETIIAESLPVFAFHMGWFCSALNIIFNHEKMFIMVTRMKKYWEDKKTEHFEMRHMYAKQGRLMGVLFTNSGVIISVFYGASGLVPKAIFVLGLSDIPAKVKFVSPLKYFVDMEKYFTLLFIHYWFDIVIITLSFVGAVSLFLVFSTHACGMMAEVEWRLVNLTNDENLNIPLTLDQYDNYLMFKIRNIVRKHNEAIEFCELLRVSYQWLFSTLAILMPIIISTTGYQIVKTFETMKMEVFVRLVSFVAAQMFHVGLECYVSQSIINCSQAVGDASMKTKWYLLSSEARKSLKLICLRSQKPCVITGTFFILSHAFFRDVMRTSMSFFLLLRSTT